MSNSDHADVCAFIEENPDGTLSFIVNQITDGERQVQALAILEEILLPMLRVYPAWPPGPSILGPLGFQELCIDSGLLSPN
jgi:hypothetical protein